MQATRSDLSSTGPLEIDRFTFDALDRAHVLTLAGDDRLSMTIAAPWQGLEVDLGPGNDRADIAYMGTIIGPPPSDLGLAEIELPPSPVLPRVEIKLTAGSGDDVVDLMADSFFDVFAEIDLGKDNDTANLTFAGGSPDPGELNLKLAAGAGDDDVNLTADSFFDVFTELDLGAGNDTAFVEFPSDPGVLQFLLDAGGGDDKVTLAGTGDASGNWDLSLNLGAGNDQAFVEFPSDPAGLQFLLDAGTGDDLVQILIGLVPPPPPSDLGIADEVPVPPPGSTADSFFDVFVDLGAGNDIADFRYAGGGTPDPAGKVRELRVKMLAGAGNDILRADINAFESDLIFMDFGGGKGNDLIQVRYKESPPMTALPPQRLHIHVLGGDGNDNLALLVATSRPQTLLDLLLDGGKGRDRYSATPNVRVINCEKRSARPPADV